MPPIRRIAQTLAAALVALVVLPAPSAGAVSIVHAPAFSIEGDPTPSEAAVIHGTWEHFAGTFHRSASCMGPLTVRVVDRAEDWFDGGTFAIAGFYRPSEATVYIEHGKVTPAILSHEFAHHLDATCGVGGSPLAADFLIAADFDADTPWYSGPRWDLVPAEQFSEALLAFLGVGPLKIDVAAPAIELIQFMVWLGADGYGGDPTPRPRFDAR